MAKKKLKDTVKDNKVKTEAKKEENKKVEEAEKVKVVKNEIKVDLVTKPMVLPKKVEFKEPEAVKAVATPAKEEQPKEKAAEKKEETVKEKTVAAKKEETAEKPKRGRKKAEPKTSEKVEAKAEKTVKEKDVKAEKKAAKTEKKAKKTEKTAKAEKAAKTAKTAKKAEKTAKKETVKKEPAKTRRSKKEVKETENSVEQVAAMINKEITKEADKSDKPAPEKKKILFVGSEVLPFAATGGLGEVLGSLPKALAARGDYDVRVMMPYYSDMGEQYKNSAKYLCNYNVGLSWRNLYCGLFELKQDNVTYYFVDNEYYFHRDGLYGFYDDGERYAFFSKAVMDSFYFIDFMPDIIHANDWQTALIPIYNNCKYHYDIKLIFTIHNIE